MLTNALHTRPAVFCSLLGPRSIPLLPRINLWKSWPRVSQMVAFHHSFSGLNPRYFDPAIRKADQVPARTYRPSATYEGDSKAL